MNKTALIHSISRKVPQGVHRQKLKLNKHAPTIMFGVGIVGSVASTVLACRATLKLHDTMDDIEKDLDNVRQLKDSSENYPVEQIGRDTAYVYVKSAATIGKLYGPAAVVGLGSIALLTRSHVVLKDRNAALMAAYSATLTAYENYRERVVAELGAEKELDIYHAAAQVASESGELQCVADPNKWSPHARFFDEYSTCWEKDAEINRLFVGCQQNYANELLRARGHLFLNEVYDMLGIPRSKAGAVVGWVITPNGSNYVDFGMYSATSADFVNGWERSILLDFNIDGVIVDKI